jgi:cAMP-dependent protein kinase regulator
VTPAGGTSALDQAHALRLAGDADGALRLSASLLTASPEDLGAALLVAQLLGEAGRDEVAVTLASHAAAGCRARGELPSAVLGSQLAARFGGADELREIAAAFGKGSDRIAERAPARPPVLPGSGAVAPHFQTLKGTALVDAAEKAAARACKQKTPPSPVPALPLFSALEPPSLERLLRCLELHDHAAGDYLLREGEEGKEALVIVRGLVNVVRGSPPVLIATLGPGAIFGEMALVSNAPRAASAVAVEPVQAFGMSRKALEELAARDPEIGRELGSFCYGRMLANLVRHSAILSGVEAAKRAALIASFETRHFERGTRLVEQGQDAGQLFLIASGSVQVRGRDAQGEQVVLAQLGPGEVVGEISLVLRRPAVADVVALHPTIALVLSREQFHESVREHPTLLRELYDIAVQREQESSSLLAQKADDVSDMVLL